MKALAARIKYRREMMGLTQRQLAEIVGLSHGAIGLYESGKREPDLQTLQRLAQSLETSMAYLLGETDDPRPLIQPGQAAHHVDAQHGGHVELTPEDIQDLERAMIEIERRRAARRQNHQGNQ